MKIKIIILTLFFLFISFISYIIFQDKKINYTVIGEKSSFNMNLMSKNYSDLIKDDLEKINRIKKYNKDFIYNDIRVIDLINLIYSNKKINNYSILNVLKNSKLIIISIGNNEINYILSSNKEKNDIYKSLSNQVNNINRLIKIINKVSDSKIIFIGYYNTTVNSYNDKYYKYINSNINKDNIIFIDLLKLLKDDDIDRDYRAYINEKGNYKIYEEIKRKTINYLKK